jgi:hypothetical protein
MSESLWSASILDGIKTRLEDRLPAVLLAIAADGGSSVSAPVSFEVRENIEDISALPGVMISAGEVESELLMPSSYRLTIPLRITSIVAPEANPVTPDDAARTFNRGCVNVLTERDTVTDISGLFYVGSVQSRIEEAGEGTRKWRRYGIVEAVLFVATTMEIA